MSFFADGASSTSWLFAAGALAGSGSAALEMSPPMTANWPPACTVLPSAARICSKTPAAGAGTSTLTLSVSNSQSISSCVTVSPGFLYQVETVASVTDSPNTGTITAVVCAAGAGVLLAGAEAVAPSLICASSASVLTVAPSAATISANVPATGLGTSTVTLSVSSSQSISSTAT